MEASTEKFIDLWEEHPMLWDPWDRQYKDRAAKNSAYTAIATAMGDDWTCGVARSHDKCREDGAETLEDGGTSSEEYKVKRKIDSLLTYYRYHRKKMQEGPGSSSASKRPWAYFERLRSFLAPRDSSLSANETQLIPDACEGESDIQYVDSPPSQMDQCSIDNGVPSASAKRLLHEKSHVQHFKKAKTRETGTDLANKLSAMLDQRPHGSKGNPNRSFAVYIADTLDQIKNESTVILLRQQISDLIGEALLNEVQGY